jgi:hypothetical protein
MMLIDAKWGESLARMGLTRRACSSRVERYGANGVFVFVVGRYSRVSLANLLLMYSDALV